MKSITLVGSEVWPNYEGHIENNIGKALKQERLYRTLDRIGLVVLAISALALSFWFWSIIFSN